MVLIFFKSEINLKVNCNFWFCCGWNNIVLNDRKFVLNHFFEKEVFPQKPQKSTVYENDVNG